MNQIPIWVLLLISVFLLFQTTRSVEDDVRQALQNFLLKLSSNNNGQLPPSLNWNKSTDPCKDQWAGIRCDSHKNYVTKILLNSSNLVGTFEIDSLCNVQALASSLTMLSFNDNNIGGGVSADIANCKQLTRLHLSQNQLSGNLPDSLSMLINLKRLEISNNFFSSKLPDLAHISGLKMFLAQNNQFTGEIPQFDFSNLDEFNVSFNNFTGSIPNDHGRFTESSFIGNPELCGDPLPKKCPPSPPQGKKSGSNKDILMYSGYAVLALALVICISYKLCKSSRAKEEKVEPISKVAAMDVDMNNKASDTTTEYKSGVSMPTEFSTVSADQSAVVSSSLVVLTSPVLNGLRFDELLRAPAELLGRGKHGSVYRINLENGVNMVVKRIKDWAISSEDFKLRMQSIDQVKHPNVLPALAFYCSKQEKLLVYEYQPNGSLLRLLHGTQMGQAFDWSSRLGVAASIAEALAFMHQELLADGIPHGNLKSSNILFNKNMEPCISEYGLMEENNNNNNNQDLPNSLAIITNGHNKVTEQTCSSGSFKADIYSFGVILLELLTAKLVQQNAFDLTKWVHSVVREEWTVEVFDKSLVSEGASEERMVNLLQVAVKCVNPSPQARPSINQVAAMINSIKEEEERSIASEV